MKVLVTGASGLLGSDFVTSAVGRGFHVAAPSHALLDVTDEVGVRREIVAAAPDIVVHCAAYTAVDAAESDRETVMSVNRDGTAYVASAAATVGAKMVHISSDYVFDGEKGTPYRPEDPVAPLSVYGFSKAEGEVAAFSVAGRPGRGFGEGAGVGSVHSVAPDEAHLALVVRTGWLYGKGGRSFVDTVVERVQRGEGMRVVNDQCGSPTWTRDVAETTLDLMLEGASGVWHVAASGEGSWLDFARSVAALTPPVTSSGTHPSSGVTPDITGVTSAEWGAPAPRPAYSVLDVAETQRVLGRTMPDWRDSLESFMGTVRGQDSGRRQSR